MRATTRLPYDVGLAAIRNANARRWSLSEYIAWCVERMIDNRGHRDPRAGSPDDRVVHSTDREAS